MMKTRRLLALLVAVAIACSAMPLTHVSAAGAKISSVPSGMHSFNGTEALIRDAVEELRAKGQTMPEKQDDPALVEKVEEQSGMTYGEVKTALLSRLQDSLKTGKMDVADLNLDRSTMTQVMEEVLNSNYLYNAISNVLYTNSGAKIARISFEVSEGYAAAAEEQTEEFSLTLEATAEAVADKMSFKNLGTVSTTPIKGNVSVAAEGDEDSACNYHIIADTLKGDYDKSGEIDIFDLGELRSQIQGTAVDTGYDYNGDGDVDIFDFGELRQVVSGTAEPVGTSGTPEFGWELVYDTTPIVDGEGNVTNGGLLYDPANPDAGIGQGILPDVYYTLSSMSFDCAVCGQHVEITNKTEEGKETLASMVTRYNVYIEMVDESTPKFDENGAPVMKNIPITDEQPGADEPYMLYTDVSVAMYMDDTFSVMFDSATGQPVMDESGNYVPKTDGEGNPIGLFTDTPKLENGTDADNGSQEVAYYYNILSAFNADYADYFGVSSDYWTDKDTQYGPMAAVKVLCNLDPQTDIPPAQMIQLVQMLPQAFMAYVYYYGEPLLAMRDAALGVLESMGGDKLTDVQKMLVLHDWMAENTTFDMGAMMDITGGDPESDPIQMTSFGALLCDQFTAMGYTNSINGENIYGIVCLGYAAGYNYLVQNAFTDHYQDKNGEWLPADEADHIVDFGQVMFYADTEESSIAGEGFGGGAFNNVHYFNYVRVDDAPTSTVEDDAMEGNWFFVDTCYDDIYIECMTQYRAEVDGSVNHQYFLVSPQTMAKVWSGSIDYIDGLYDGYTYQIAVDSNGNPLPSENVDSSKDYYDATHPKYEKVENKSESYNDNTCYEDTWFSGAVSKIYRDGDNWYYVDAGSSLSSYTDMMDDNGNFDTSEYEDMMDMDAMMHSTRVDRDSQDVLKSRPVSAPDYWEEEEEEDDGGMSMDMTMKEDTYAKELFNYGTGEGVYGEASEALLAAIEEDYIYNEQYPGLTHCLAVSNGVMYINLGNQIWKYDGKSAPELFREYNHVSGTTDGRKFTASSYTIDSEGTDIVVENNPVAGLCLRSNYTPLFDYLDAEGNTVIDYMGNATGDPSTIVGMKYVMMYAQEVFTVNVGTNYSYSAGFVADADGEANRATAYKYEAVNLNPDYSMGMTSDDDTNKNEEFLWCANIREDVAVADWAKSVSGKDNVACSAKNDGHKYAYNKDEGVFICENCNLHAVNIVAEDEKGATVTLYAEADSGLGQMMEEYPDYEEEIDDSPVIPVSPAREAAVSNPTEENLDTEYQTPIYVTVEPSDKLDGEAVSGISYVYQGETEAKVVTEVDEEGRYVLMKPKAGCITISVEYGKTKNVTVDATNATVDFADDEKDPTVKQVLPGATVEFTVKLDAASELVSVTLVENVAETTNPTDPTDPTDPSTPAAQAEEGTELKADENGVYSFTMPENDVTLVVKASKQNAITLTTPKPEYGKAELDKTVAIAGETVTVTVTPTEDYMVAGVNVAAPSGVANPETVTAVAVEGKTGVYTFVMPDHEVVVTVDLVLIPYKINVTSPEGTVTAKVGDETVTEAAPGETVTLTVTPNAEYKVTSIVVMDGEEKVAEGTDNTLTFEMPKADVTVTVTYAVVTYGIDVKLGTNGSYSSLKVNEADAEAASKGDKVVLTLAPTEGYAVSKVAVMAGETAVNFEMVGNVVSFTMPGADVKIDVTFAAPNTITVSEPENGTAAVTVYGVTATGAATGVEVVVTATPAESYRLAEVTVMAGETKVETTVKGNVITFTMPEAAVTVTVTFEKTYTIDASAGTNGAVSVKVNGESGEVAAEGDTVTVTATPVDGYEIGEITVMAGDEVVKYTEVDGVITFTMPASAVTVKVTFAEKTETPAPSPEA